MARIEELKEQEALETPLLLFECELPSGSIERWSTHGVEVEGQQYLPRVLRHNLFEFTAGADDGTDSAARVSLTLADADSRFSQIERQGGWKGARLCVRFLFHDLAAGAPVSEQAVIFRGVANPPEEITESTCRVAFTNRLNLQRVLLPQTRIQRRCPWIFPSTAEERVQARDGGARGKYSGLFKCGYSPDVAGGAGNLDGGVPFESCDYTRKDCETRGMFDCDSAQQETKRFGGIEFVPPSVLVRGHGEKGYHLSPVVANEARYNDFVPIVYGTAWYQPPIVFARNDGNLTRVEVLLGVGEVQGVLKVVANGVEIPQAEAGTDMSGSGWHQTITTGGRNGAFNMDFADGSGAPLGDPYGSMAALAVVLPNRLSDGQKLPKIEVLIEGLKLPRFDLDGNPLGECFTNNPAWVLLDVLQRSGWSVEEIDLASFAAAAQHCDEPVASTDLNGNPVMIPRYQCNLVLQRRRSAAETVKGIRNASALAIGSGPDGRLQLRVESTFAGQHPTKPAGSNASESFNGGWPAYEFSDGSAGFSGILRRGDGTSSVRVWSRATADTPNRFSVEFQDAFNEYQQDSLSLMDLEDVRKTGQEINGSLNVLGLPNYDQAARALRLHLDRSVRGNLYLEFETSVRGVNLRPGDLITFTYLKEGMDRMPFRIQRIVPGMNFRTVQITAQRHDDEWYSDMAGLTTDGNRRQPRHEIGLPRPLVGTSFDEQGRSALGIEERGEVNADGSIGLKLAVSFQAPEPLLPCKCSIPTLSLSPAISTTGGTIGGGQTLYYAVSATDEDGRESPLSFVVRASVPAGTQTNRVTLTGLSFAAGTAGFRVYRGRLPGQLARIADEAAIASEFTDAGRAPEAAGPPDPNFDHVNVYWRMEFVPEQEATIFAPGEIGNGDLHMAANEYRGATVRITRGKGAGQEAVVDSNTETILILTRDWQVTPDATSVFVVVESAWHLGAWGRSSPLDIEVPNREGATVHVCARSANVQGLECAYELSPVTRWRLGGMPGPANDLDIPPQPSFSLTPVGNGALELAGIGFPELGNTRSATAAVFTMHFWPELATEPCFLAVAAGGSDEEIVLGGVGPGTAGDLLQVDSELMVILEALDGGARYRVTRASHGSTAAPHAAQTPVYHLHRKTAVIPFSRDFFGSPASGSFSYPIPLPDVRVAAAELFFTNSQGSGPAARTSWVSTVDKGLRTLSGGQLSLQVEGTLAIQANATPPLVVEASHSVRDVFAVAGEAPVGAPVELRITQGGAEWCTLSIPAGSTISNVVSGTELAPLVADSILGLDIVSVGQGTATSSGADLTVTIRL
mgnify:CR=1 FL=1